MSRMAWLGVALVFATPSVAAAPKKLRGKPNLASLVPSELTVAPLYTPVGDPVEGRWAIRFTSVIENRGRGPLILNAHRKAVGQPCAPTNEPTNRCEAGDMTADQVVIRRDGTRRTYRKVAKVFFDEYHFHWHMKDAERYVLRNTAGLDVARDTKTGFCLGDRHTARDPEPPHYRGLDDGLTTCKFGHSDPATDGRRALKVHEGLSPGWRDDYPGFRDGKPLEGQQVDLTGLPAGVYVLVNRVNPDGLFKETTLKDNASSLRLRLSWPDGTAAAPAIKVVRRCPGTTICKARKARRPR